MIEDDDAKDLDYDFDADDGEFDDPLYVFCSTTGHIFLSAAIPPEGFPLAGSVEEIDDFFIMEEDRPLPTINWLHEEPAALFHVPGTLDYAIRFPDSEPPPAGYQLLGEDFAFVLDEEGLKRATEADS